MTESGAWSSCARATTAKEAAFRIDYPLIAARHTRIIALDPDAAAAVREIAGFDWDQARFYTTSDPGFQWLTLSGETVELSDEISESNTVVLVSTDGTNAEAAATIGDACKVRGIMTAGLVLTPGQITTEALMALRPHARILMVPADTDDLVELLRAIRA